VDTAGGQGLFIRLLGPLRAFVDGREVALGPPLQRALFTVLAVRANQVVYSSELIDAVWGDEVPERPEGGVHTYIAGLRRALEPGRARRSPGRVLESRSPGYRLNLTAGGTDLAQFERHREEGRRAHEAGYLNDAVKSFEDALALFDGEPLGGVPGPFAETQRRPLADQRLALVEDRTSALLDLGRHRETIGPLRILTSDHPLRERPWTQLMLALYRDGRPADALAAFEQARAVYAEELGLDPGAALTTLRQQIVVGDPALSPAAPAASPAVPYNLLRDIDHFTGRDRELGAILAMAGQRPGGTRGSARPVPARPPLLVCAIDGMPGVGKTTLAVHAAHRLGERYPDARLYIDLHGHTPGQAPVPAAAALDRLLVAAGVPSERVPAALDDRAALWRAQLTGRAWLLVLDNAADAAQVRPLLPGSPGSFVLITSRRRMPGLDGCEFLSLGVLPARDAAALFTTVAGPARAAAEPEATASVLRVCGYLPLAVQIAAARLRHRPGWSVAHLWERLAGEDRRLAELQADDRSVAAAFALSCRSLSPDGRRFLRLLSLFPGLEIDLRAAAALAAAPVDQADRVLQDLVDAHLLDEPQPGRYRLHDLLAVFAARLCEQEESPAARRAALERLLDFYLHTVDSAEELLRPQRLDRAERPATGVVAYRFERRAQALAWLDSEQGNFVSVVAAAAEHGFHRHAWQIPRYLWGYFELRGHRADWIACYELALGSARQLGDRLAEARILVGLGVSRDGLRQHDEAISHYRSALALMRETGYRSGEAGVLTNLGNSYSRIGRLADSISCNEQALRTCRDIGDQAGAAIALANLGELYADVGRFAESLAHQEESLVMFRASGDRRLEGCALDGLGRTYLMLRQYDQALSYGQDALAAYRDCGDRNGESEALARLGQVHWSTGRIAEAERSWRDALEIAEDLEAPAADDIRTRLAEVAQARTASRTAAP
jgi:DNA-binding SARP family transcriptional activator